jgi:hypothetical protein
MLHRWKHLHTPYTSRVEEERVGFANLQTFINLMKCKVLNRQILSLKYKYFWGLMKYHWEFCSGHFETAKWAHIQGSQSRRTDTVKPLFNELLGDYNIFH